jgi:hypothetical protein
MATIASEIINLFENNTFIFRNEIKFGDSLLINWSGADNTDGTIVIEVGSSNGYSEVTTINVDAPASSEPTEINFKSAYSSFKVIVSEGSNTEGTATIELVR